MENYTARVLSLGKVQIGGKKKKKKAKPPITLSGSWGLWTPD